MKNALKPVPGLRIRVNRLAQPGAVGRSIRADEFLAEGISYIRYDPQIAVQQAPHGGIRIKQSHLITARGEDLADGRFAGRNASCHAYDHGFVRASGAREKQITSKTTATCG